MPYPKDHDDASLRAVARQWSDDGADGETVHALTREVIRLRAAMRIERERLVKIVDELHRTNDLSDSARSILLKTLEE